jgi:hypothetical protein
MSVNHSCECEDCKFLPDGLGHWSDCAVHNGPASPKEECDCGASEILNIKENWGKDWIDHAPYYIETLLNWILNKGKDLIKKRLEECQERLSKVKKEYGIED